MSKQIKEFIVCIIVSFVFGILLGFSFQQPKIYNYNDNMKDCLNRDGVYRLTVKKNSNWNYEKCSLDKEIEY